MRGTVSRGSTERTAVHDISNPTLWEKIRKNSAECCLVKFLPSMLIILIQIHNYSILKCEQITPPGDVIKVLVDWQTAPFGSTLLPQYLVIIKFSRPELFSWMWSDW